MKRLRRGVSLIEVVIFFTIAVILMGVAWSLLSRGSRLGRTAVQGIALQQGIRGLVENMVRDVNGCLMIHEPNAETLASASGGPHSRLVVYLNRRENPADRPSQQQAPGGGTDTPYPFAYLTQETKYQIPVLQVSYEYNKTDRTVTRIVTPGALLSLAPAPDQLQQGQTPGIVQEYQFSAAGTGKGKVLAREVAVFRLYPFSYDHTRAHAKTRRPPVVLTHKLPGEGARIDQTVGVVLKVKAAYRSERKVLKGEDSSMEIVTKIWSYPKLYDHIYRPYFSSVDGDLRY
jgi:hypothetical protein